MEDKNTKKVFVYSRVSTSHQELLQQERATHEWLKKHNLSADVIVADEGVSGRISYKDRKLGKELLPKLNFGDVLVVSEVSRLGRSMGDISDLINNVLKKNGIRLVITAMNLDLDCSRMSALDELILSNFAFAAQLERELTSERVSSAVKAKIAQGVKFGKANEKYKYDDENQKRGIEKRARTKNYLTIVSRDFQALCRIMKRVYPLLLPKTTTDEKFFMLDWKLSLVNYGRKEADACLEQMQDLHADNPEVFSKWDFSLPREILYAKFFSRMQSVFRTIERYKVLNEESHEGD